MKNYGYLEEELSPDDYQFGAWKLPEEPIQNTGNWDYFLPVLENQNIATETNGCVSFTTTSILEILHKKLYGEEPNYSDRFLAIVSDTDPYAGNTPKRVIDAVRKKGLIDEELLPFTPDLNTPEKYYQPMPMTTDLLWKAKYFLDNFDVGYEWVATDPESIKEALKRSPLGIAVYAWAQKDGLYYRPEGAPDVHYTVLYGYEEGKYFKVYDSYENNLKKLDWNFGFRTIKRYHLAKKETKLTYWDKIKRFFGLWS